jgi:ElaB/YqjD/DUF883 family membrane-anchored ribosome-binding protein
MKTRIERLRFIFDHASGSDLYVASVAECKETVMETPGKPLPETTNIANKVASRLDRTRTGAHNTIDKVSDAARPAVDRLASGAHRAVDAIAGAATQAAQTVAAKGSRLKNAEAQLVEDCRTYVRSNPGTSIGIAVGAGFILGRLLRSR